MCYQDGQRDDCTSEQDISRGEKPCSVRFLGMVVRKIVLYCACIVLFQQNIISTDSALCIC